MKITISELPPEGLEIEGEVALEQEEAEKAAFRLMAERSGREVFLRGELSAGMRFLCSRCLTEFTRGAAVPVDVSFRPVEELSGRAGDEKYELTREELDTGFYRDDELDVDEVVREQMLLSMPMKPLCREGCRGLCPKCGANLNEENCQCAKEVDERLKKLELYFKEGKKE